MREYVIGYRKLVLIIIYVVMVELVNQVTLKRKTPLQVRLVVTL